MVKIYSPKILSAFFISFLFTTSLFIGCEKADDGKFIYGPYPDLSTQVKSSVNGFVTDENDQVVTLATVQVGAATFTTDKYGYFVATNVDVVKEAAVVTVSKTGYFKGIKTYMAEEGKSAFFRIKLIRKVNAGTVNAAAGGSVTLANGLSIILPANAVVNASTNAAYTGTVNVAAYWLNPTAADLSGIMPGDLRGINSNGKMQLLTTYGMAAVELTGSGGELLQMATGKKALLGFPIPSALLSSAPVTIPLWYFDEAKGLWKEEGTATKTGDNYVGEVSHFSTWNVDIPEDFVQFSCTLVDQNSQPIPYAFVKISRVSNPLSYGGYYSGISGYASGAVPKNSQLKLEVFSDNSCTATAIYTQLFTTGSSNISLGTITLNNTATMLNVSGTATNCINTPLNAGLLILRLANRNYIYPISNGTYHFNIAVCNAPATVSISTVDLGNQQASLPFSYTLNTGNNIISNIQSCGVLPSEYTYYTIDGTPFYQSSGGFYFRQSGAGSPNNIDMFSTSHDPAMTIPHSGFSVVRPVILPPGSASLYSFSIYNNASGSPFPNPITVNYTEYGNIGQYIGGSFAGTIRNNTTNTIYNVTCSFRMKRSF